MKNISKIRELKRSMDWQIIDQIQLMLRSYKYNNVPAGSLVLWDIGFLSKSIWKTRKRRKIVQYVCYLPKNHPKNTLTMRKKKGKVFENVELQVIGHVLLKLMENKEEILGMKD